MGIKENETTVLENFMENINSVNGRYEIELPFEKGCPILPDNYGLSVNRLKLLKARLEKTPELLRSYDNIFEEQLKSVILEKVTKPGDVDNVMYLPHREVMKEGKLSTKLRIVFDASAKMSDQVSLNDVLYKGPCLTPLLFNMLLRFRVFPVAIIGDIEKAYLQISVAEKHRDFLRCVWYKDVFNKNPEILKFRFLPSYIWSSSLAIFIKWYYQKVIKQLCEN